MSERIAELYAEARARVEDRIAEIDAEIRANAIPHMRDATRSTFSFSGGGRRYLTDRIVERLALVAVLEAHDDALQDALAEEQKRLEYHERVEKPKIEAESKKREIDRVWETSGQRISEALHRVKSTINRLESPDPADVDLLRRNRSYADRYNLPGSVEQLLWRIDRKPWWRKTA